MILTTILSQPRSPRRNKLERGVGTTRVEISYAYGQKSIEISWKSREISEKWKSEIKLPCARRFSAPYSSVDCSKLQGCGARTRSSGRPATPSRDHRNLDITGKSEITRKSRNLLNWKSVESRGNLEIS